MNYSDFIYLSNLSDIEQSLLTVNENFNFDNFKDKIINSLSSLNEQSIIKFINDIINKVLKYVKNIKRRTKLLLLISSVILSFTTMPSYQYLKCVENAEARIIYEKKLIKNDRTDFIKKLAFKESSNKWDTTNRLGYIGLFQFGQLALNDVGLSHINYHKFKKNPNIFPVKKQIEAVNILIDNNIKYMRNYLHYEGKNIKNITITKSGIIAASHLVGQKKVKKFLSSGGKIDPVDGNKVHCSKYMKEFAGYNLDVSNDIEYDFQ